MPDMLKRWCLSLAVLKSMMEVFDRPGRASSYDACIDLPCTYSIQISKDFRSDVRNG